MMIGGVDGDDSKLWHHGTFMLSSAIPPLVSNINPVCTHQVLIFKVPEKFVQLMIALPVKSYVTQAIIRNV